MLADTEHALAIIVLVNTEHTLALCLRTLSVRKHVFANTEYVLAGGLTNLKKVSKTDKIKKISSIDKRIIIEGQFLVFT